MKLHIRYIQKVFTTLFPHVLKILHTAPYHDNAESNLFLFYSKCKDVKTKNWKHVTFYYYRYSNNCISSISVRSKQLPCGKTIWCEYDQHAGYWGEIAHLITRHSWYSSFFLESSLGFFFLKNRGILSVLNLLLFVCVQNKCCSVETGEERPILTWSQTCSITVSFFIEGHFNSLHLNSTQCLFSIFQKTKVQRHNNINALVPRSNKCYSDR